MLEEFFTLLAFFELKKTQWDKEKLKKMQEWKFKRLINAAWNTPFYKRLWIENGITREKIKSIKDLEKLPIISKEDLRKNYTSVINKREFRVKIYRTSGTTSVPFEIHSNLTDVVYRNANYLRVLDTFGINFVKARIAYYWYENEKRSIIQRMLCRKIYLLSKKSDEEHVLLLKKIRPEVLFYFPWRLYNLLLVYEIPRPKLVILQGELLHPKVKKFIKRKLKVPVANVYATQEFGFIAWSCKHDKMHINSESVIVEEIDGEFVITNLNNYVFPLIRYKVGDKGKLTSKRCKCGRVLPCLKIKGRKKDIELLGNPQKIIGILLDINPYFAGFKLKGKEIKYVYFSKKNKRSGKALFNLDARIVYSKPVYSKSGKLKIIR